MFEGSRHKYLVLEFVGRRSLFDLVYSEREDCIREGYAQNIFGKVVNGIEYLHTKGVCHRDLKLDNIIVGDKNRVKIIDFGFSMETEPNKKISVFCGTPSYIAPEILKKEPYDGMKADIWSLGVCIYRSLSGGFPFKGIKISKSLIF